MHLKALKILVLFSFLLLSMEPPLTAQMAEVEPDSIDLVIDSLNKIGIKLRAKQPDSAFVIANQALEMAITHQKKEKEGDAYRVLGLAKRYAGEFKEALEWQEKAMEVFTALKDTSKIAATYVNLGNVVRRQGQLTTAYEYQLKGLKLLEEMQASPKRIAVSYNNIGNLYREMEDYEEALSYHNTALEIREELKDTNAIILSMNNIGIIYYKQTKYDTATVFFDKALELAVARNLKSQIAKANVSLGNIFYKLEQYERAEQHYSEALAINVEQGNKFAIYNALNNLGLANEGMKQYRQAEQYFQEAIEIISTINSPKAEAELLRNLSNVNAKMGDYEAAYSNFIKYKTISDTLFTVSSADRLSELRTTFETEKKEEEINRLQEREQLQQRQRRWLIAGLLLFALLAILASIGWWLRSKANQKLQAQQTETKQLLQEKEALLTELSATQSQLIASEKMASLGQLTAGIAHEINNPVNFITSSLEALKLDFEDIQKILNQLFTIESVADQQKIASLLTAVKQLDATYTAEEMGHLIGSIERGAYRTQEIVKNLRTFSRDTSEEFLYGDVHEGLDSTLLILQHKLKGKIELHKNYDILPIIPCQISRLNQVFLNILDNAIQAIPGEGTISVRTKRMEEAVLIQIQDSGTGISPELIAQIFDPFFTTKEVGQGTGLGLSISYSIIEQHKGHIEVASTPGQGTTFSIHLPINAHVIT